MINGNKDFYHPKALYAERRKIIQFFQAQARHDFDLYGPDWYGYPCWKGVAKNQWDTLKHYKFCICYENMGDQRGMVTDKIFNCFVSGCVPVYLGATNVTDYVSSECFIDRRQFKSNEELYVFLKSISKEQYEAYLHNIALYLQGEQAYLFSIKNFIDSIIHALNI